MLRRNQLARLRLLLGPLLQGLVRRQLAHIAYGRLISCLREGLLYRRFLRLSLQVVRQRRQLLRVVEACRLIESSLRVRFAFYRLRIACSICSVCLFRGICLCWN